ncbi:MAG: adenylosuccinate synthetase, partial [Acidobacteriota bacterium]
PDMPADPGDFERARPVYETVPGWRSDITGALDVDALPRAARDYIRLIEDQVGASVDLVSSGPRREETAVREAGALQDLLRERFGVVIEGRS